MSREIHYLLSHPPHGAFLAVSIRALRNVWDGPIHVHGWPHTGAWEIVEAIGNDPRLQVTAHRREPAYRGRSDHLLDKISIMSEIYGVDSAVLLDADTIPVHSPVELFELAEQYGYVVTQFCDWMTTNSIIRNRVKRLLPFDALDKQLINDVLTHSYPSPNVGVFGTVPGSPVMPVWYDWSFTSRGVYIADESAMQALLPMFMRTGLGTIVDGRWNCSTMRFQHVPDEEVKLWHGHGNSFIRKDKSPKGFAMWWALYQDALQQDIGGINTWIHKISSKHFRKLGRIWTDSLGGACA